MFENLTVAKKALEAAKAALKLKDQGEILEAIIPLQEALNRAQEEATEALSKIHELTQANIGLKFSLTELQKQRDDRQKYELFESPFGGHFWKLKKGMEGDYPNICPVCIEEGSKSGLQKNGIYLNCPRCRLSVKIEERSRSSSATVGTWRTL